MTLVCALVVPHAEISRYPWLFSAVASFLGIFIFDGFHEITASGTNMLTFVGVFGFLMQALTEQNLESFWHDSAAALFFVAVAFEKNAQPWSGKARLRSTFVPSVLFFILVLAQSMPTLSPEGVLTCAMGALLLTVLFEAFYLLRESSEHNAGSFMSAMRLAIGGIITVFYCATFLPDVSKERVFIPMFYFLPALGSFLALAGFACREVNRRHILFCSMWSAFIFWAAFSGGSTRILAALVASVFGAWTVIITRKKMVVTEGHRGLIIKLSGWAVPGSLLFVPLVFMVSPSENQSIQFGTLAWVFAFVVFWCGLSRDDWSEMAPPGESAGWRYSAAITLTILSSAFWAVYALTPESLDLFWRP